MMRVIDDYCHVQIFLSYIMLTRGGKPGQIQQTNFDQKLVAGHISSAQIRGTEIFKRHQVKKSKEENLEVVKWGHAFDFFQQNKFLLILCYIYNIYINFVFSVFQVFVRMQNGRKWICSTGNTYRITATLKLETAFISSITVNSIGKL